MYTYHFLSLHIVRITWQVLLLLIQIVKHLRSPRSPLLYLFILFCLLCQFKKKISPVTFQFKDISTFYSKWLTFSTVHTTLIPYSVYQMIFCFIFYVCPSRSPILVQLTKPFSLLLWHNSSADLTSHDFPSFNSSERFSLS